MANSRIRVLNITTHDEECGIAKYQQQFINIINRLDMAESVIFPYSPNKLRGMSDSQFEDVLEDFSHQIADFDIVHAQHELSFYAPGQLKKFVDATHSQGKIFVTTVHTAPRAAYPDYGHMGIHPKRIIGYLKGKRAARKFVEKNVDAFVDSDLILVHNQSTFDDLVSFGIDSDRMRFITMPVPAADNKALIGGGIIREKLGVKEGDVVIATLGFLSRSKGVDSAIKALSFLPENYKLAVIGGVHPGGDHRVLDEIADLIVSLKLNDRVYITGFVEDDTVLHELIGQTSVCVYPYDPSYYSYVSSAAINLAFASHKPVVAYPVSTIVDLNKNGDNIAITKSCNYYELARSLREVDYKQLSKASVDYAKNNSYSLVSKDLVDYYSALLPNGE